jgi:hypothetical protein
LEIAFAKEKLRTLCENKAKAETSLGIEAAVKLRRRLADLVAAENVKELIAGGAKSRGDLGKELVIELDANHTLVLTPNHMVMPTSKAGNVDWKKVRRVKILRIDQIYAK